jgi:Protein of unknown function (DUF3710)
VFRRRRQGGRPAEEADERAFDDSADDELGSDAYDEGADDGADDEQVAASRLPRPSADRAVGPWDVTEVADPHEGRADLGGLLAPVFEGMELRVEVQDDAVVAVTAVVGPSAIQLQPFAAPRTEGIWTEVRTEIAASITQQGGLVDQQEGPLGPELRAQVPVQLPDGTSGAQVLRFVGCDGPRWFLRGVISGQAAAQPETAGPVEEIFRGAVVVRGGEPMAPRDPIPLRLPDAVPDEGEPAEGGEQASPDLNPFQRGPEITEVR